MPKMDNDRLLHVVKDITARRAVGASAVRNSGTFCLIRHLPLRRQGSEAVCERPEKPERTCYRRLEAARATLDNVTIRATSANGAYLDNDSLIDWPRKCLSA